MRLLIVIAVIIGVLLLIRHLLAAKIMSSPGFWQYAQDQAEWRRNNPEKTLAQKISSGEIYIAGVSKS